MSNNLELQFSKRNHSFKLKNWGSYQPTGITQGHSTI